MSEGPDEHLATIDRPRDGRVLRVSLGCYQGTPFVQLRQWFRDPDGNLFPTKAGTSVRRHELRQVIEALLEAERRITRSRETGTSRQAFSGASAAGEPQNRRADDPQYVERRRPTRRVEASDIEKLPRPGEGTSQFDEF